MEGEKAGSSSVGQLDFDDVEVDPLLQQAADEDKARGFRRKLTNAEHNQRMVNSVTAELKSLKDEFKKPMEVAPIRIVVEDSSSTQPSTSTPMPSSSRLVEGAALSNQEVLVEVLKIVRQEPWIKLEKQHQLALISGLMKQLDYCHAFWRSDEQSRIAIASAIVMVDLEKVLHWYDEPQSLDNFEVESLIEMFGLDQYNTEGRHSFWTRGWDYPAQAQLMHNSCKYSSALEQGETYLDDL